MPIPFCRQLADSLSALDGGLDGPVWIVLGGVEATRTFAEEHSLPATHVFSLAERDRPWVFSGGDPFIPFTPLRVILDRNLAILDLSQSRSLPSPEEMEEFCVLESQ